MKIQEETDVKEYQIRKKKSRIPTASVTQIRISVARNDSSCGTAFDVVFFLVVFADFADFALVFFVGCRFFAVLCFAFFFVPVVFEAIKLPPCIYTLYLVIK